MIFCRLSTRYLAKFSDFVLIFSLDNTWPFRSNSAMGNKCQSTISDLDRTFPMLDRWNPIGCGFFVWCFSTCSTSRVQSYYNFRYIIRYFVCGILPFKMSAFKLFAEYILRVLKLDKIMQCNIFHKIGNIKNNTFTHFTTII